MNNIKKISVIILFLMCFTAGHVNALPDTILKESQSRSIASGIYHENIRYFTNTGWLNVNVLIADLKNPYIGIDTLSDEQSIRKLSSPLKVAQNKNAVAAINGSFFMWTNEPGTINPIGPYVQNGQLKTVYSSLNASQNTIATLSFDYLNKSLIDFWKTQIFLKSPGKQSIIVERYNRPYYGYEDLSIIDRNYSTMSIGTTLAPNTDIVEMVVADGIVVEMRQTMPARSIPSNGFIVVTRGSGNKKLIDNYEVGDTVSYDIKTSPIDYTNLKTAVSGGAVLVKNGSIPSKFSHDVPGLHPRTAAGITKEGQYLILVVVDGRQQASIGLTQKKLAQLMIDVGAYNAVNLDGGGSSSMLIRDDKGILEVINTPSDGLLRLTANTFALMSNAPVLSANKLSINSESEYVFVNTSIPLNVTGKDTHNNPVIINQNEVKYSVSKSNGYFEENMYIPINSGRAVITALYETAVGYKVINVLDKPAVLNLSTNNIMLPVGASKEITAVGVDKNGFKAPIEGKDLSYVVHGDIGYMNDGIFTASKVGSGYVEARLGDAVAYFSVSVPQYTKVLLDDFEKDNAAFNNYPSSVKGRYSLSKNQKYSGSYSGKLHYNFLQDPEELRAAYIDFNNDGITLSPATSFIGIWVYNETKNTNQIRAEVYDTNDVLHRVVFTPEMGWIGWKHFEASLEDFTPARLKRIYVVQIHREVGIGDIYFDDLTATVYNIASPAHRPSNPAYHDPDMESVIFKPADDSFRFAVFGQSRESVNAVEHNLLKSLAYRINAYVDVSLYVGGKTDYISSLITKPSTVLSQKYGSLDYKNSLFISLNAENGKGLRESNIGQWQWLLSKLNSSNKENIFIFMSSHPDTFNDKLEGELFKNTISNYAVRSGKKVWVFYHSTNDDVTMQNGVKYIGTGGFKKDELINGASFTANFVLVTIRGNRVTYEYKPILHKKVIMV